MKYQKKSGFSIVLAMGLVLILSFTGLYLLEYMIPFSRNIKGIENASQAFYESYSGIEDSLLLIHSGSIGDDYSRVFSGDQDFKYSVISSGMIIPIPGKGNSEYDTDWNKISQDNPISLLVGHDRLNTGGANRIRISLRVPDFNNDTNPDNLRIVDGNDDIIIWQLSSTVDSISTRSGSLITESDINLGMSEVSLWNTTTLSQGVLLDGNNTRSFQWFYNNNPSLCTDLNNECVLKISIIRPLISSNAGASIIPYLEYQIHTDTTIPFTHSYIVSSGKSYGFTKTLEVAVPVQSTSSAFDFTVLQ